MRSKKSFGWKKAVVLKNLSRTPEGVILTHIYNPFI